VSRIASRTDVNIVQIMAKLMRLEEVYSYSSFGSTSPFVSTSEPKLIASQNILLDVIDRLFSNLPSDTVGIYFDYGGSIIQLQYTDVIMSAIDVNKAYLDACAVSRNLTDKCFAELKKITDKVQYVRVDSVTTKGNASQSQWDGSAYVETVYAPSSWPASWQSGFFKWVNRYDVGLPSVTVNDTYKGSISLSVASSWFSGGIPSWFAGSVFARVNVSMPTQLPSSGVEIFSTLGDGGVVFDENFFDYSSSLGIDFADIYGDSYSSSITGNPIAGGYIAIPQETFIEIPN
jgi:hypothetical protein